MAGNCCKTFFCSKTQILRANARMLILYLQPRRETNTSYPIFSLKKKGENFKGKVTKQNSVYKKLFSVYFSNIKVCICQKIEEELQILSRHDRKATANEVRT